MEWLSTFLMSTALGNHGSMDPPNVREKFSDVVSTV